MRYAIRRTMKAFHDIETEWPETAEQALKIFEELVPLYTENLKKLGRDGKFASSYYYNFQKKVIKSIFSKNSALLFKLKSKQYGTLGCFYFLVDNGIAYFTQIGLRDFDPIELGTISKNRLKIGYLIHMAFMEECFKRNIRGYSFSTGVYPYKLQLTNDREVVTSVSVRKSIKPAVREGIMGLYAKIDHTREASWVLRTLRTLVNGLNVRLSSKAV